MKLEYRYSIIEDDGYEVLDVPAFPEIVVAISEEDRTLGRIEAIVDDAIKNAIKARIDYNDTIPTADGGDVRGNELIFSMSPLLVTKILLYKEFRKRDCSKSEFAKLVGVTPTTVNRLFDLTHESRFEVVMQAFKNLELRIVSNISVRKR